MPTRDDEIAEEYEQQNDAEHHVGVLGQDDSIRARLPVDVQARLDAILRAEDVR